MPKCIRCGKCVECRTDYKGWVIITYNGPRVVEEKDIKDNSFIDIPSGLLWSGHTMIGLCPDCQLPERGKSGGIKTDNLVYTIDMFHQHEKDILDIGARLLNV